MEKQLVPIFFAALGFLIPAAIIGLMIWLYLRARRQAEERRRMLRNVAAQMGWAFAEEPPASMIPNLGSYYLFSQGHSKKMENMLYGEIDGGRAAVFDYAYTVGHGKNRHRYYQTVVYFQSHNLGLPLFSLRPENVLHKLFGAFGYQDIDFAQRPEFSKRYLLRGQDEAGIRRLFSDRLLSFYETNQRVSTDGGGDQLFFYQENVRVNPENIQQFLQWGRGLALLYKNPW
ncbi:MAG TPA: hypothetical protein VF544_14680 [Pyrinomonadaceae bacterium]|jgi:hypothetical protein